MEKLSENTTPARRSATGTAGFHAHQIATGPRWLDPLNPNWSLDRDQLFVQAAVELREARDRRRPACQPRNKPPSAGERACDFAHKLWEQSTPIGADFPCFLDSGLTVPPEMGLRVLRTVDHPILGALPAIIGEVADRDGRSVGCYLAYLTPDLEVILDAAAIGYTTGGAVRLFPAGNVLAIAASIDDALAFHQMTGRPTWLIPGPLESFQAPAVVRDLIVAADGPEAAEAAAKRLLRPGLKVQAACPPKGSSYVDALVEMEERRAIGGAA